MSLQSTDLAVDSGHDPSIGTDERGIRWRLRRTVERGGRWFVPVLFLVWMMTPLGPINNADVGITPMQFSSNATPLTGLPGLCTSTNVPIELDGTYALVGPWEALMLNPMSSQVRFSRCDTGAAVRPDMVRLEQAWRDPTCSLSPDSDFTYALSGWYSSDATDGYWLREDDGCRYAVGIGSAANASTVKVPDPDYRVVFRRGFSWTERACLAGTLRATVTLAGWQTTTDLADQIACLQRS